MQAHGDDCGNGLSDCGLSDRGLYAALYLLPLARRDNREYSVKNAVRLKPLGRYYYYY